LRIVRNARRVLPRHRRELGLQEQVIAREFRCKTRRDACANSRFIIVFGMAGSVNTSKAGLNREPDQASGVGLLPGSPVENSRYSNTKSGGRERAHTA